MKKLIFTFTALLFIAISCVPQPTLEPPPLSETPSSIPTITPIPVPDIIPSEWASNESGVVIPQKMYPLVGAIDKRHRRTIDLDYGGLNIAVVLGEGVDLQDSRFTANQRDIRSFYAVELNNQEALKHQLEQLRTILADTTQNAVVIVEGQDWPDDLSVSPPPGYVSQVVEFGETKRDEIKARYVLENGALRPLSKEEMPQPLPGLAIKSKQIIRNDTGEIIQLQGITIDRGSIRDITYEYDSVNESINLLKAAKEMQANFVTITYATDFVKDKNKGFIRLAEEAEKLGLYIAFIPSSNSGNYADPPIPDDQMIENIAELGLIMKNENNVIMDIYNDPHPVRSDGEDDNIAYNNAITKAISSIRSKGFNGLIMVPGNFWSLRFDGLDLNNINDPNIIYRVHDLPWVGDRAELGISESQDINNSIYAHRDLWMFLLDNESVPNGAVLIGEFGFPGTSPLKNTAKEKQWQERTLQIIKENNLSFAQYDTMNVYRGNAPYETGILVKDYLSNNPPYQFDE